MSRRWAVQAGQWRDPAEVVAQWQGGPPAEPEQLRWRADDAFWGVLAGADATLLVSREYEHLLLALRVDRGRPQVSYLPLPHPSGVAVDRERGVVHVASTRNPNLVYDLAPAAGALPRRDMAAPDRPDRPLVPVQARYYPGSLYLHDLAIIAGQLHANAVGQNAVVRLCPAGGYERVWWPRCVETASGPRFDLNHIQLNSIAAGASLADSYFSASGDRISRRRPGHRDYPVDRRGVVFHGGSREPVVGGLTRPHSARLSRGALWVDNSGYGEVGRVRDGRFEPAARLPGWTRGLCFLADGTMLVGTSRVLPRFERYAPGLDLAASVCGVHAVDPATGRVIGSLLWPAGNQIFALEWLAADWSGGLPFRVGDRARDRARRLFYAFETAPAGES